ncbi:MAG: ankyrin repeat domain-containing protein [Novosphingobium sp.]
MLAAAGLGLAAPAGAQFSQGYKFLEAVRKKDGTTVEAALSVPGSTIVNSRDGSSGQTALHIVTMRRDATWMVFMLQKGANVNARDSAGATALQIATNLGFTEGVELLIRYKADPEQANDAGETPLISAVHRRDTALMRVLLAGGADPDHPDSSGRSARDYARLDGGGQLLATLDTHAKPKGRPAAPARAYGPSF